ncbi:MAG TPA: hypothetical protein VNN79_07185, partial [Actinomycetota bacterium]|nr:hypothetical protein [Actinomycetota bacterium]
MKALSERLAAPDVSPGGRPFAIGRVVLAIARVEGRRLVRNPLFLVGIALSVAMTLMNGNEPVRG